MSLELRDKEGILGTLRTVLQIAEDGVRDAKYNDETESGHRVASNYRLREAIRFIESNAIDPPSVDPERELAYLRKLHRELRDYTRELETERDEAIELAKRYEIRAEALAAHVATLIAIATELRGRLAPHAEDLERASSASIGAVMYSRNFVDNLRALVATVDQIAASESGAALRQDP